MRLIFQFYFLAIFSFTVISCKSEKEEKFMPKEIYKTETLVIAQIAKNSYQHTSFLQTEDFGYVPCNGLIVKNNNETIVFDTPTTDKASKELMEWITKQLNCNIKAIIPTHFHDDCLGGLQAFHEQKIPSYAYFKTIDLAKANHYTVPQNSFNDSLKLSIGSEFIIAKFFGEGHTRDNIVGYYPLDNIMFGGCLIKELDATKGYLGDANTATWSRTVDKIKKEYPNLKIIVPGHGTLGNTELLDYTSKLFKDDEIENK
ncbi:Metallo-beta-lactamase class B [Flavobacterium sp. 9AF]|uniref:subclass B1 metallo-beta-lactamase n=1 Tax=Flavobacterium sp. 9AF TaxID=2653142 RepID=UPI0012EF45CE|nr:subclass B1 metallo-beta-lactamase [Flavobacterium sp. 9AF]VXB71406.1 Metallo-beta-lactamase class B [Flavobacterium sp. 9AF]